jgi:hypothetical protein
MKPQLKINNFSVTSNFTFSTETTPTYPTTPITNVSLPTSTAKNVINILAPSITAG